jgi:hypothetical protein
MATTTIGFIGAGHIGSQVARLAIAHGNAVVMSNSRGPETPAELVAELGPSARARPVSQNTATPGRRHPPESLKRRQLSWPGWSTFRQKNAAVGFFISQPRLARVAALHSNEGPSSCGGAPRLWPTRRALQHVRTLVARIVRCLATWPLNSSGESSRVVM